MPGILPTHLTTILSLLFPIRTFTALLMVMLSRLTPFTSTSLSPTVSPASTADTLYNPGLINQRCWRDPTVSSVPSGTTESPVPAVCCLPSGHV
uniref:Uncharacterized protein n=1 Tax=Oreochromis niloticus TaxID=8128 RepID=A0A669CA32_ORENI